MHAHEFGRRISDFDMNTKKCAILMAGLFAGAVGLAACDSPTWSADGAIFTYTDARGNRVAYTAEDLLNDYRQDGTSLSTEFDHVYEVLIRNYYADESQASVLTELQERATSAVLEDKQTAETNAESNGTSYEAEFEAILDSAGVDNVDELYEHHLYEEEQARFQQDLEQTFGTGDSAVNGVDAMRDGTYTTSDGVEHVSFPESEEWGAGNDGWLKEQMPYHFRHILVKLNSGIANEYTQDKISESTSLDEGGEATDLANVVMALAGAGISTAEDGSQSIVALDESSRWSFSQIANVFSDDTGSAASYGDSGIVTKVMETDYVPEFKLGAYAFESLYNERNKATEYGKENRYRVAPGLREDAEASADGTITDEMIDENQVLDGTDETVYSFFENLGIGQIPFGAAIALLEEAKVQEDANGNPVNNNVDTFYPRNVIYNKYFNRHNICVITPNEIATNTISDLIEAENDLSAFITVDEATGHITSEDKVGKVNQQFASLPGFQVDTTNVLPQFSNNVLTDEKGQIVLAVRAGSDSYQGIHFIVIERSALSEYGQSVDGSTGQIVENEAPVTDGDTATLSEYYTTATPNMSRYPTYEADGETEPKTTYVNFNISSSTSWTERANEVSDEITSYNPNLSSYNFQRLVEEGAIEFADQSIENDMKTYVQTSRQSNIDSAFTTWSDNWKAYAEKIAAQEQFRAVGEETGTGYLISEICAVDYQTQAIDGIWDVGGACYYPANA